MISKNYLILMIIFMIINFLGNNFLKAQNLVDFPTINWPIDNNGDLTGSFAEIRRSQSEDIQWARFHEGVDIPGAQGTDVYYRGNCQQDTLTWYVDLTSEAYRIWNSTILIRQLEDTRDSEFIWPDYFDGTTDTWRSYRYIHIQNIDVQEGDQFIAEHYAQERFEYPVDSGWWWWPKHLAICEIEDYGSPGQAGDHLHYETTHYSNGMGYADGWYDVNPLDHLNPEYSDGTIPTIDSVFFYDYNNGIYNTITLSGSGTQNSPYIINDDDSLGIKIRAVDQETNGSNLGLVATSWELTYNNDNTWDKIDDNTNDYNILKNAPADTGNSPNVAGARNHRDGVDVVFDVAGSWIGGSGTRYKYWVTNHYNSGGADEVCPVILNKMAPDTLRLELVARGYPNVDSAPAYYYLKRNSNPDHHVPVINDIYFCYEDNPGEVKVDSLFPDKYYDIVVDAHDIFYAPTGNDSTLKKCNPQKIKLWKHRLSKKPVEVDSSAISLSPLTMDANSYPYRYANGSGEGFLYIVTNDGSMGGYDAGEYFITLGDDVGDVIRIDVVLEDWSGNKSDTLKRTFIIEKEPGIDDKLLPDHFAIFQNYPNPFNPVTTIQYQVPEETMVNISIFNQLGQKVTTILNENKKPGYYNAVWNGKNDVGQVMPGGVYYCLFKTDQFKKTKKMILVK